MSEKLGTNGHGRHANRRRDSGRGGELFMNASYSAPLKMSSDYSRRAFAFFNANADAALDYMDRLLGVTSWPELVEVATEYQRRSVQVFLDNAQELAAMGETVAHEAAETATASRTLRVA